MALNRAVRGLFSNGRHGPQAPKSFDLIAGSIRVATYAVQNPLDPFEILLQGGTLQGRQALLLQQRSGVIG